MFLFLCPKVVVITVINAVVEAGRRIEEGCLVVCRKVRYKVRCLCLLSG